MKKIYIILNLLLTLCICSQNNQISNVPGISVPNFTPPSPEAFSLTKYGDLPLNEFTGMLNVTVPLYSFKSGNLTLPLSLNYNGAGIKIDDIPTKTGMTWILSAGGVINRTIKDLPDSYYLPNIASRVFLTEQEFENLNTPDGTAGATMLSDFIGNANIDTEADIYNYSFGEYSGSFFINQNLEPVLLKEESELKILLSQNFNQTKIFTIITPDGIKYYFGGNTATEGTFNNSVDSSTPIGDVSFYLTQIEHPIYGKIYLEYLTTVGSLYFLGGNESKTYLTEHNFPDSCVGSITPPTSTSFSSQMQKITNARYINKIWSSISSEMVKFLYLDINGRKILDRIDIFNATTLRNSIKLNYFGINNYTLDTTRKRFFLKEIVFNNELQSGSLTQKTDVWSFDYDDIENMTDRLSFGRDSYGYANGIKTNITLMPSQYIKHSLLGTPPIPYFFNGANHSVNFEFAKKGTLVKVIYPTKGYSKIEYETIPYKKFDKTDHSLFIDSNEGIFYCSVPGINTLSDEVTVLPAIFKTQDVKFVLKIFSNNFPNNHNRRIKVKVTNLTDAIEVYNVEKNLGMHYADFVFNVTFLQDKQYKVELWQLNPETIALNTSITATLNFTLVSSIKYETGIGMRVKSQIDYSNDNSIANYKRYYYMAHNKIYAPIWEQPMSFKPNISYQTYSMVNKVPPQSCFSTSFGYFAAHQAYYTNISTNAISNKYVDLYGGVTPNPIVTTSFGGDNFENGGVEKLFYYNSDTVSHSNVLSKNQSNEEFSTAIASNDFITKNNNLHLLNGDLLAEYYFKKKANKFLLQKKIQNIFQKSSMIAFHGFCGKKVFEKAGYWPNILPGTTTSNYFFKTFSILKFRNILIEKNEKLYFEDFEMPNINYDNINFEYDDYAIVNNDDSLVKKITTQQIFSYGALKGLPTISTTTTSDSNIVIQTKSVYPNEVANVLNFSSSDGQTANKLVAQNRFTIPLQVQQFRNNELLSTQKTKYNVWNNNPEMVLPSAIQVSKGSAILEDRAFFEEYDMKGNPTIVSLKDGVKTKYYYNTLNQVVMKIENYQSSFNIPANPTLTNPCSFIDQYPLAFITIFEYDVVTNLLSKIIDPKCESIFYEYDALHRLKNIRDQNNNIVKTFDNNYKQ